MSVTVYSKKQQASDLEYCCVQILKGKFWCDAGHDLQVIFEILSEKKLMDCNEHGQMVEVTPNSMVHPKPDAG